MIYEKLYIKCVDNVLDELIQRGDLEKIWNGVGSGEVGLNLIRPPARVQVWFSEASKFHDVAYYMGGTDEHRAIADEEFTRRCFKVVYRMPWIKRIQGMFWLQVCGDAVRNFGSFTFEYRDVPITDVEKLLESAAQ